MAILDSILVGKGRGKIGNVVLSVNKGQTVAKQLNSSPANPRTDGQVMSRYRMCNIVLAFQFLAVFFSDAKALRKPLESIYNAVVRLYKNAMDGDGLYSALQCSLTLLISGVVSGNWISVVTGKTVGNKWKIDLATGGLPYVAGTSYRLVVINEATGAQTNHTGAISEVAWAAGTIDTNVAAVEGSTGGAYIFTADGSKCSGVSGFQYV